MRLPVRFAIILLVALSCAIPSRAQFTQPSPDELQMASAPKAPGAAAIYLYREVITDDRNHFVSVYARIKVLTEKGKDFATVTIPYERGSETISEINGRTIHSDGSIVPLTAQPADLMDFKVKRLQENTVVFSLPDVQVGSILEYRLKIRTPGGRVSEPTWEVQTDGFALKEHFEFHAAINVHVADRSGKEYTNIMWTDHLPTGVKVIYTYQNNYALDVSDVPAIPKEEWMGPINTQLWSVRFYYTNSGNTDYYWGSNGKQWSIWVDQFTKASPAMTTIANSLYASGDSDLEKARKLYDAVQKLDNARFSRYKTATELKKGKVKEIRTAEDVWSQQSGTDDQITLLYIALCRAAGLKAYPARVVSRGRALFDRNYLSERQLDDYLAIVSIDRQEMFLDPGQKFCPFGSLNWRHQLAGGLRTTEDGPKEFTTPAGNYLSAKVQRIADLTVDATGDISGSVRVVMTGPEALEWRQLSLKDDSDEVRKEFSEAFNEMLPAGISAEFGEFTGLNDSSGTLTASLKVSGSLGSLTGKHLILPAMFFQSRARHNIVAAEKRDTPIDLQFPRVEDEDVTYHLPSGYSLVTLPDGIGDTWEDHAFMHTEYKATEESVHAFRSFTYDFTVLDPAQYSHLRDYLVRAATTDQTQLVLAKGADSKAN